MHSKILKFPLACLSIALLQIMLIFPAHSLSPATQEALPAPQTSGGKPLMDSLMQRQSNRSMSRQELPAQELSNLLWAAWGINRPEGKRTVPTALDRQDMKIYLLKSNGLWDYDAAKNSLIQISQQDYSTLLGKNQPLTLLYVLPEDNRFGPIHAGAAAQNVYLYCASAGLATVVKFTGAEILNANIPLPNGWKVLIIQELGYPR